MIAAAAAVRRSCMIRMIRVVAVLLLLPCMCAVQPALARTAPASFADLAARLLPGVVTVSSSEAVAANSGNMPSIPGLPPGSPFEKFFHDFMQHQQPGGAPPPPIERRQALGSGFIIDPSGIIVTNNHVIRGADTITVTLHDGTILKAKLLGADSRMDLAVLKVNAGHPLPAVDWGNSDHARVGDWVMAIGNPFGLGGTVTAGIISARGRNINEGPYDNFIQTDAPINMGNSGGPLFDMNGHVIGINTAIYSPSGGSIGIGFSIPSNAARVVVDQLWKYGHARRGYLGVMIQDVSKDIAESLGLKQAGGAMVAGVVHGGPGDKAGLRTGDVILSFDGKPVKDSHALPRIVAATAIGRTVPVEIWRGNAKHTVDVVVGELPPAHVPAASAQPAKPQEPAAVVLPGMGLSVGMIDAAARQKYHLPADQKGVVITAVDANSPAAQRGVQPGDVILEVQQREVSKPADVLDQIAAVRREKRLNVLMLLESRGGTRWVPLPLASASPTQKG
ncbi:MAG: DegQ family serine endoprotease [Rhodospirillales bacterium]|nr:DegQ family serine endoprotease [Rhodospirillales bacterium]